MARDCLSILLDAHQLIPTELWQQLLRLLTAVTSSSADLRRLAHSTTWLPLEPLLLGIAPFANGCLEKEDTANVEKETLLADRALDACLGLGGFDNIHRVSSPGTPDALCEVRCFSQLG